MSRRSPPRCTAGHVLTRWASTEPPERLKATTLRRRTSGEHDRNGPRVAATSLGMVMAMPPASRVTPEASPTSVGRASTSGIARCGEPLSPRRAPLMKRKRRHGVPLGTLGPSPAEPHAVRDVLTRPGRQARAGSTLRWALPGGESDETLWRVGTTPPRSRVAAGVAIPAPRADRWSPGRRLSPLRDPSAPGRPGHVGPAPVAGRSPLTGTSRPPVRPVRLSVRDPDIRAARHTGRALAGRAPRADRRVSGPR
jgi:hypothetical protein